MSLLLHVALVAGALSNRLEIDLGQVQSGMKHPHHFHGVESEFLRQWEFLVLGGTTDVEALRSPRLMWFVLTADHLLVYRCIVSCAHSNVQFDNDYCIYPDGYNPLHWFSIGTLHVGNSFRLPSTPGFQVDDGKQHRCTHTIVTRGLDLRPIVMRDCFNISGIFHSFHKEGKQRSVTMTLCGERKSFIKDWMQAIERAHLDYLGIPGQSLPKKVAEATQWVKMAYAKNQCPELKKDLNAPGSFSPLLCPHKENSRPAGNTTPEDQWAWAAFEETAVKFSSGAPKPFVPGENSRSGAAFFKSADGSLMAKRIRKFEYISLWKIAKDCGYHRHITKGGTGSASILNPIYLAFESSGQHWVIIKTEGLPQAIDDLLPPKGAPLRTDFFFDVKPGAMKSDREQVAEFMMRQAMVTGLNMSDPLKSALERLHRDVEFLESHQLVDYSLVVAGAILQYDGRSSDFIGALPKLSAKLMKSIGKFPQCGVDCGTHDISLIDVTAKLTKKGPDGRHFLFGQKGYKCCCIELRPGESALVRSPCALVLGSAGCGQLLGSRFHSYWRTSVGGRCLVRTGGVKLPERPHLLSLNPLHVLPEAPLTSSFGYMETCVVFCVAVLDYLLEYTSLKAAENIVLVPVYGERKWSDYKKRTTHLFSCLMDAFPAVQQEVTRKDWAIEKQFVKMGVQHKDCSDVFPSLPKKADTEIVQSLVWKKL